MLMSGSVTLVLFIVNKEPALQNIVNIYQSTKFKKTNSLDELGGAVTITCILSPKLKTLPCYNFHVGARSQMGKYMSQSEPLSQTYYYKCPKKNQTTNTSLRYPCYIPGHLN